MKKRILASVLSAALVVLMAVALIPATASAASANAAVTIQYNSVAPKVDGVLNTGEYGLMKVHSVDYNNDEFLSAYDQNKSIQADFYACWTDESLYMCWVVYSELDDYYAPDNDGNMWEHCCIQYILLPHVPSADDVITEGSFYGDFFEGGVCIYNKTESVKCNWSTANAQASGLTADDWDFAGSIDDSGEQIKAIYEVRMPWNKSGVTSVGNGTQFGLSYAIADQEDFTNVEPNMCEWQDAILGSKQPKNCGVITLAGKKDESGADVSEIIEVSQVAGGNETSKDDEPSFGNLDELLAAIPENATKATDVPFNTGITAGSTTIVTDPTAIGDYGVNWAGGALLAPTSEAGVYKVVEIFTPTGSAPVFSSEIGEGYIVLVLHGDDSESKESESCLLRDSLTGLEAGNLVHFVGYDFETATRAEGSVVYWVAGEMADVNDVSEPEESVVSEPEESEVSEEPDASAASEDPSEAGGDEKSGSLVWLWIVTGVVVVAAVVAVIALMGKKKAK